MLDASSFANENKYYLLGIGMMDAIIIKSVLESRHAIWTLDRKIIKNLDAKYLYRPA